LGYKRKARVIFLSSGNGSRSLMAAAFANQLGGEWMEGYAAVFSEQTPDPLAIEVLQEAGMDMAGQSVSILNEAWLNGSDLLVAMDPEADQRCPPLPAGAQKRCYFFADPTEKGKSSLNAKALYREVRDQIRQRVQGMIGGMKLLQRASVE